MRNVMPDSLRRFSTRTNDFGTGCAAKGRNGERVNLLGPFQKEPLINADGR